MNPQPIEKKLKKGKPIKLNEKTIEYVYNDVHVRVSINEENMGSIQTAFPETK